MLSALILIPILGALTIFLLHQTYIPWLALKKDFVTIEYRLNLDMLVGLTFSLVTLLLSLYIWISYNDNLDLSQYTNWSDSKEVSQYEFYLGLDGLNIFFMLLTTFITPIALLSNYNTFKIQKDPMKNNAVYVIYFLLLESLQLLAFLSLDLFMFYVFFESILPILFIVIIVYGSGEDKLRSAYLLFLYTLTGSLFMLLAILSLYNFTSATDFLSLSFKELTLNNQIILWLAFFTAFAVKTPLWPLAAWLYRAHADSPLAGSILLAGTVLKLATYGFLRISITILPDASAYLTPLVMTVAVISLIYASFSTIIQEDTKVLIAYSSICHMAVVVLGLFSNTVIGIQGAIILSIAHGFVSPALFIAVGGVIYDQLHTRKIKLISGIVTFAPKFSILFLIFILANTGIPLSLNFIGEQLALIGTWEYSQLAAVAGATGILFSACYSVLLYNRLTFGSYTQHMRQLFENTLEKYSYTELHLKSFKDIDNRETVLLVTLLIPTILLGVSTNFIIDSLNFATSQLIYMS